MTFTQTHSNSSIALLCHSHCVRCLPRLSLPRQIRLDTSSVMLKAIRSRSCNYYKQVLFPMDIKCVYVCVNVMFLRVFCLIPNKTVAFMATLWLVLP